VRSRSGGAGQRNPNPSSAGAAGAGRTVPPPHRRTSKPPLPDGERTTAGPGAGRRVGAALDRVVGGHRPPGPTRPGEIRPRSDEEYRLPTAFPRLPTRGPGPRRQTWARWGGV